MPMVHRRIIVSGTLIPNLLFAGTNGYMPCLPPASDLPNDSFINTAMYAGRQAKLCTSGWFSQVAR
jgi:hypothetical protein